MNANPFKQDYRYIKRRDLIHDARYQRTRIRKDHVHNIASAFNTDIFGVLHVAPKGNKYAVIDGWHRVSAIDELGATDPTWGPDCELPCLVHNTVNEAFTFLGINTTKPLTPLEKLKAAYQGGDANAIGLITTVWECGLEFAFDNHVQQGHHYLPAVTCAQQLYQENPDMLKWTLQVILAAWGPDPSGLKGPIIGGVNRFATYVLLEGAKLDTDRLVKALSKVSPDRLARKARAEFAETATTGVALTIREIYNKESRSGLIPQWTKEKLKTLSGQLSVQTQINELGEQGYKEYVRANAAKASHVRHSKQQSAA